jgi:lipid-A-disaccharide synthase-like uncharacterized protein
MLASIPLHVSWNSGTLWLTIGFVGQILFGSRFVVQWLASEKAKQSIVPLSFWYLSLAGGMVLLAYAIYQRDPVFIAGQAAGSVIYIRNLVLIRRPRGETEPIVA